MGGGVGYVLQKRPGTSLNHKMAALPIAARCSDNKRTSHNHSLLAVLILVWAESTRSRLPNGKEAHTHTHTHNTPLLSPEPVLMKNTKVQKSFSCLLLNTLCIQKQTAPSSQKRQKNQETARKRVSSCWSSLSAIAARAFSCRDEKSEMLLKWTHN